MTEEELSTIAERAERATPGPWKAQQAEMKHRAGSPCCLERCGKGETVLATGTDEYGDWHRLSGGYIEDILAANGDHVFCTGHDYNDGGVISIEDAEFAAHARNDIPQLLAEIARLKRKRWWHR